MRKCHEDRHSGRDCRNPGYMDVFELAIHGTGTLVPAGLTTSAHCLKRRTFQRGNEFFTTLAVRNTKHFWRHSHVECTGDEKNDFNAYPYAKLQPTITPHPDS
jgi:hypothetical protein